ncbi:orotidine-5'-phosphate decarboxylase [Leptospira sp. 96542]|nr:orotidine-5'-phosphate decarboxylase [Leptospira sp. 96542]
MSLKSNFVNLFETRREKLKSLLCIGIDPEFEKLPEICKQADDPIFHFAETILKNTHKFATAWKPNIAFFERFGSKGYLAFEKYVSLSREICPEVPIIADAKRGDLANTSKEYAKYFFQTLKVDALTVNPYMGRDSLLPYLDLGGFIFVLGLTSNPSSGDFQKLEIKNESAYLFEVVSDQMANLESEYPGQVGLVVGGTHISELENLRKRHPHLYFLIPGFGAQGGDLKEIYKACGKNSIINSSRSITLASVANNFGEIANEKAKEVQSQMNQLFS